MSPNFAVRATDAELMDAVDLEPATYAALLRDLARVNTLTLARPLTLGWLRRATRGIDRFSLVDIGYGHGDMLRAIARWARQNGKTVKLVGIDLNPRSEAVARAATGPAEGIDYRTGDAADLDFAPDFIISSLVAHHMADAELVGFLRWMEATATRGWLINDLQRHWLAWAGFSLFAGLLRWHPIVRHDGALSVRRSFVRSDWDRLLAAAGLDQPPVMVRRYLQFRWGVGRLR